MPDMLVKLYDLPEVSPILENLRTDGIVIRPARAYEKHLVLAWVRDHFSPGWASECDVAFSNHPVSCLIAVEAGTLVGFACYECTCKDFFGPTGVAEEKRGRGIGKGLFLAALAAMAAAGYAYAIVGGAGPTEFYARTAGAIPIEGSSPGFYRGSLKAEKN